MTSSVDQLARIRDELPKLATFVVYMRPTDAFLGGHTEEGAAVTVAHIEYLWELQSKGILLGSGPVGVYDPDHLEGMCFLAALDMDEAVRIAENEPFHKRGWRVNEVKDWRINEGVLVPHIASTLDERRAGASA